MINQVIKMQRLTAKIPTQPAIKFPADVQIGNYYQVPCIALPDSHNLHSKDCPYVPVSTHLHEDTKVIGFPHLHWHIDWRFAGRNLTGTLPKYFIPDAFTAREQTGVVFHLKMGDFDLPTDIHYRKLKCKRKSLAGLLIDNRHKMFVKDDWVWKLPKAFCKSKLKEMNGQLVCPHKGAIIDKNCTDKEGNYVCPAHLLRFNPQTHQVVVN